jgi:hypothetical protein
LLTIAIVRSWAETAVAPVAATATAATVLNRDFIFSSLKSRLVVQPVRKPWNINRSATNIFATNSNTFFTPWEAYMEIFVDFVHEVGV